MTDVITMADKGKGRTDIMSHHLVENAETITRGLKEALAESERSRELLAVQTHAVVELRAENDVLRSHLAKAIEERDFFQRHSMTLVARLNMIHMVIEQSMQEAKASAAKTLASAHTDDPDADVIKLGEVTAAVAAVAKHLDSNGSDMQAFLSSVGKSDDKS